jgi:L-ribulokinase
VNPALGGCTFGWNLTHTAQDELFAAIEGTALHTRVILDRMAEYGVPIRRVINGGGIPQKNETLNQVYANVFNKPVLVPLALICTGGRLSPPKRSPIFTWSGITRRWKK